ILSSVMKFAILRQAAGRIALGLIEHFGIRATRPARLVVSFVDQSSSTLLEPVAIRGIPAERHQYHRVVPTKTKVHSLLKTGALPSTHFDVGNDVASHRFNPIIVVTCGD